MQILWNPWYGCFKKSTGCQYCYISRGAERKNIDFNDVHKSDKFYQPLKRKKDGSYHYPSGTMFNMCFSSDFLLKEADEFRTEVWKIIKERKDCKFFFLTKRIERFKEVIPDDFCQELYPIGVGVSCENQEMCDFRIPYLRGIDVVYRVIALAPMLEKVSIAKYLDKKIDFVTLSGESGGEVRYLDYDWVMAVRDECQQAKVDFNFRQTGSRFVNGGTLIKINYFQEVKKARELNLDLVFSNQSFYHGDANNEVE